MLYHYGGIGKSPYENSTSSCSTVKEQAELDAEEL
jgi:hypothetical protein